MNWKKLTIGVTIVNILAWVLLEIWSFRYADSNVNLGAGWLVIIHLIGYYIIVIGSKLPKPLPEKEPITPANCPGHDWQNNEYSNALQKCVICEAKRGRP